MEYMYLDTYQTMPYIQNYPNPSIPYYNVPNYIRPYQNCDPRFKQSVVVPSVADSITQKTDDELWIETYLSKIGKININLHSNVEVISKKPVAKPNTNKKVLTMHVANTVLHRCLKLLSELEKLEEYLRTNVATISSAEWKEKSIEIGQQKDEFTSLLSQFDDTAVLEQLSRAIKNRKKKRLSQKRKKDANRERIQQTLKNRQALHKKIDNWLESMKESVEKAKREEYLKMDADCVLSEVTKKKSDARKQLNMLSSLIKLRAVREQAAIQRGEKVSLEDSNAFKQNTERLLKMWEHALKVYTNEEQELRKTLEQNAANEIDTAVSEQLKITSEWESVLFGPKFIPNDAYWSLTCAEKDLGTFIAIRKSWDTFLVSNGNNGSRIPIGWVLPDADKPNEQWSQYLEKQ